MAGDSMLGRGKSIYPHWTELGGEEECKPQWLGYRDLEHAPCLLNERCSTCTTQQRRPESKCIIAELSNRKLGCRLITSHRIAAYRREYINLIVHQRFDTTWSTAHAPKRHKVHPKNHMDAQVSGPTSAHNIFMLHPVLTIIIHSCKQQPPQPGLRHGLLQAYNLCHCNLVRYSPRRHSERHRLRREQDNR